MGSLIFISAIAYVVTRLTEVISCVTGINPYVIAFTALAAGTSWPDLVASKIAAERQLTADSAIANITYSNSVNIYVGIGVPWLIDTIYIQFLGLSRTSVHPKRWRAQLLPPGLLCNFGRLHCCSGALAANI